MSEITKALPHNLDAERAVLGALLLAHDALDRAVEKGLTPADFFVEANRHVFAAALALQDRHVAVDIVTVCDELIRNGKIELAGGAGYISALVDGVPAITNVEHYAQIVKEKALLRGLAHTAYAVEQAALAGEDEPAAILERAEQSIFALAEERVHRGLRTMAQILTDCWERLEALATGKRITGLSTGYPDLDELTGGLHPKRLVVLAARPSIGKTALAVNIAQNVAGNYGTPFDAEGKALGAPVALFSFEMSEEEILLRMLAAQAKVNTFKLTIGKLEREEWLLVAADTPVVRALPVRIDDATSTVQEMAAKCRRMKRESGLALVVIDYLQLMHTRERFGTRNDEVGGITRALKDMAKELRVPVLLMAQLTRAPAKEERRPQLHDLRDSGEIEQHADTVLFLHRPGAFTTGKDASAIRARAETELIVGKQRSGPVGQVKLTFVAEFTRFEQGERTAKGEGEGGSNL